jgi:hypothetical protein
MSLSATESYSSERLFAEAANESSDHLAMTTRREVERLATTLFLAEVALHRRSVFMADVSPAPASSLWLAIAVASVLGRTLNEPVHVLSISDEAKALPSPAEVTSNLCVLEHVVDTTIDSGRTSVVNERIALLKVTGCRFIVHLPNFGRHAGLPTYSESTDGIVLLVRAAHTHRAALQALTNQLAERNASVLGSVLLDRIHPIPERLYRWL